MSPLGWCAAIVIGLMCLALGSDSRSEQPQRSDRAAASREHTVALSGVSQLAIPKAEDIKEIIVECYNSTGGKEDLGPFAVLEEDWPELLSYFGTPELATPVDAGDTELGSLRIRLKVEVGGMGNALYRLSPRRITWFLPSDGKSIEYSLRGMRCRPREDPESQVADRDAKALDRWLRETCARGDMEAEQSKDKFQPPERR